MWYVIQTIAGEEHKVSSWIHHMVDPTLYHKCFVPLYEDVWKKNGVGHITVRRLFGGYVFLETEHPQKLYPELKKVPHFSMLLSSPEKNEEMTFLAIRPEEEAFLNTILRNGLLTVSYVKKNYNSRVTTIIGPLESYREQIVKLDLPHRRAIVELPMLGEVKRMKFGLWTDVDDKIPWIEEAKRERQRMGQKTENVDGHMQIMLDPWDWKGRQELRNAGKTTQERIYLMGIEPGDCVVNTTGIYGDQSLKVVEVNEDRRTVVIELVLFGSSTRVEMKMEDVRKVE
ncbi:MAG: transcription termination/antitermination NusG family protein [Clostridium sp.]|nr:transcription termination/antitermination NusG family protein [Clostridium sp.]